MLRESIGAAIRGTGRKVARTPLSVWIAALLLVLAVFTSLVSGVRELRLQAQSREALAQVKSARMAARIVSAQSGWMRQCAIGMTRCVPAEKKPASARPFCSCTGYCTLLR